MTHPHAALVRRFYDAFAARDAAGMGACYHDRVVFSDPVFPHLEGAQARGMWAMLVARGKDLRVEASAITGDEASGSAHWDAYYTFSATGRKVINRIDATFEFADGLIVRHVDRFDLWKWSRQALGPVGLLLGWSPIVRNKVRAQAAKGLDSWMRGP